MSTSALTTWAAVVAGGAVVLLVAIDRRQPARPRPVSPRGQAQATPEPVTGDQTSGPNDPVRLIAMPAVPYRRTPWWRRILSFGGLGVLALVLGALLAVVVGLAIVVAFLALNGTAR